MEQKDFNALLYALDRVKVDARSEDRDTISRAIVLLVDYRDSLKSVYKDARNGEVADTSSIERALGIK